MTISGFVAYVKQLWKNKPDTSTPLSAARLTHMEDGIKGNNDAIAKIAAAVVNQIVNDPDKIASMAALYAVKQQVDQQNSDIGKINTWLLNGQLYLEERNYTSLNIDGTTYTGSTTILWIRITNAAKTRQMLLGKMISSSVSDLYTNFVSGSKILVQTVTDATWSNVRSL